MLVLAVIGLVLGVLWIVMGALLVRARNWKPNALVGYRTARSMSSQEAWIRANRFFGWCLAAAGVPLLVFGALSFGVEEHEALMFLTFLGLLLVPLLVSILLTELHLRRG